VSCGVARRMFRTAQLPERTYCRGIRCGVVDSYRDGFGDDAPPAGHGRGRSADSCEKMVHHWRPRAYTTRRLRRRSPPITSRAAMSSLPTLVGTPPTAGVGIAEPKLNRLRVEMCASRPLTVTKSPPQRCGSIGVRARSYSHRQWRQGRGQRVDDQLGARGGPWQNAPARAPLGRRVRG